MAFDKHAEEVVALKVLENVAVGSEDLSRLRRELAMARRITHPGIVRLHDLVEIDGRWALSMEFVEGSSLESRIESGVPFTADEITMLAREMAAALAAAHKAGVTHRDLKPANVLLRRDLRPVISDFGISRAHGAGAIASVAKASAGGSVRATQEGSLIGTPLYMSPEQLQGKSAAGPVVDVYALGLILFEIATGTVPHADVTLPEIVRRRSSEDPADLSLLRPDLSAAFTRVVNRCLTRSAQERYPDGTAVLGALTAASAGGPESRGGAALRAHRRERFWAMLAGLSTAIAISATALILWRRTPSKQETPPEADSAAAAASGAAVLPKTLSLTATRHRRVTFGDGCEEFPSFLPDSKRVVFDSTVGARSNLHIVDLDTGEARQLTASPGWDFAGMVSPDGSRVAFLRADVARMAAYVMDLDPPSAPRLLIGGSLRPTFTPDGKSVWAGERTRPSCVDANTALVIETATMPPGKSLWRMLALSEGDLVAAFVPFLDGGEGGIRISSGPVGDRVWRDLVGHANEEVLAVSPDRKQLIFARQGPNSQELVAVPLLGGTPVSLAESGITPGKGFAYSPDGRRVVWSTCKSSANVVPLSEDAGATPQAWEDTDSAALPDGKLALISGRDGTAKPWIIDPSGVDAPRSFEVRGAAGIGASPDGKKLAVAAPAGIFLVDTTSEAIVRPLTREPGDSQPGFTADGKQLLFTRRVGGERSQIFRISLGGGDAVAVGAKGSWPTPLPHSDDFLFLAETQGVSEPMVWETATGSARPLSKLFGPGRYSRAAISRDGRRVALARNGTEVVVADFLSGRIERSISMRGDQLERPIFLSDGKLYVTRTRWLGDIWTADVVSE